MKKNYCGHVVVYSNGGGIQFMEMEEDKINPIIDNYRRAKTGTPRPHEDRPIPVVEGTLGKLLFQDKPDSELPLTSIGDMPCCRPNSVVALVDRKDRLLVLYYSRHSILLVKTLILGGCVPVVTAVNRLDEWRDLLQKRTLSRQCVCVCNHSEDRHCWTFRQACIRRTTTISAHLMPVCDSLKCMYGGGVGQYFQACVLVLKQMAWTQNSGKHNNVRIIGNHFRPTNHIIPSCWATITILEHVFACFMAYVEFLVA